MMKRVGEEIERVTLPGSSGQGGQGPGKPRRGSGGPDNPMSFLIPIALVFLVFIGLSSLIAKIPAGSVGVGYSISGGVTDKEYTEGWHFKPPWVSITLYSIRSQVYTMSLIAEEGQVKRDDRISAITNEGLTVDLDLSCRYKIIPEDASDIHKRIGPQYESLIIRPKIRSTIRSIISQHAAKAIYGEQRKKIENTILAELKEALIKDGIIIEELLLRNVELPSKIKTAIEEKLDAEQQAQRMSFVLDKEQKEATRKVIQAQGEANATIVRAEGQAEALNIINEAIAKNSDLLRYKYLEVLQEKDIKVVIAPTSNGFPVFMPLDLDNST